jgi:hypothetical protein
MKIGLELQKFNQIHLKNYQRRINAMGFTEPYGLKVGNLKIVPAPLVPPVAVVPYSVLLPPNVTAAKGLFPFVPSKLTKVVSLPVGVIRNKVPLLKPPPDSVEYLPLHVSLTVVIHDS